MRAMRYTDSLLVVPSPLLVRHALQTVVNNKVRNHKGILVLFPRRGWRGAGDNEAMRRSGPQDYCPA